MTSRSRRSFTTACTAVATSTIIALGLMSAPAHAQQAGSADSSPGSPRALFAQAIGFPEFGGEFYTSLPTRVENAPGEVIKQEPSSFSFLFPRLGLWTDSTLFAYSSEALGGESVPVVGTLLVPQAPWPGPGPRPLVAFAPGTQGIGSTCQASKLTPQGLQYETAQISALLAKGWAVVVTDYMNDEESGKQNYMNRVEQGHAVLDAARAATKLGRGGVTAESPVGLYGYSQGGGATAAAAELHASYAPDVNLKGTYAGGTPADLTEVISYIDGSGLTGAVAYALKGLLDHYPSVNSIVETRINDRGRAALEAVGNECTPAAVAHWAMEKTNQFTNTGVSFSDLAKLPEVQPVLQQQTIGNIKPDRPVLVGHNRSDDSIPFAQARTMAGKWCQKGAHVQYTEVNSGPIPIPVAPHGVGMFMLLPTAVDYMDRLFHDAPVPSNCE